MIFFLQEFGNGKVLLRLAHLYEVVIKINYFTDLLIIFGSLLELNFLAK
jgi:hypothetical protein